MNLKRIRLNHGLRQEDVAKEINKTTVAYGYYENGRNEPDIQTLLKLADYYGCSVDYLLDHRTSGVIHLDSFTPEQQNVIKLMQEMNSDQVSQLSAYASFLVGTSLSKLAPKRPW